MEPKPGIPPSPRHVTELVDLMRARDIKIILAANYFDEQQIRTVASRVDAVPVIVPLYVGGERGTSSYFDLVDYWIDHFVTAARETGEISSSSSHGVALQWEGTSPPRSLGSGERHRTLLAGTPPQRDPGVTTIVEEG